MKTIPLLNAADICAIILFTGTFAPASARAALPDDLVRPYVAVDTTVQVNSYPILKPLSESPVRVLFIGDAHRVAPAAAAVMARLDCTIESVLTTSRQSLGEAEDRKDLIPALLLASSVTRRLRELLKLPWDVIWLDYDINAFPEEITESIITLVDGGTGLVGIGTRSQYQNIATDQSAETRFPVMISYRSIESVSAMRCGEGLILVMPPLPDDASVQERGDWFNSAAFCVYEAANRRSTFTANGLQVARKPIEHESIGILKFRVDYYSTESDTLSFTIRCRNHDGELVKQATETHVVSRGRDILSFSYPTVPVGVYSLDVTGVRDGKVVFFSGTSFEVETVDRIELVRFWYPTAPRGGFVMGTVTMGMAFREGMYITVEIIDGAGNILNRVTPPIAPLRRSVDFSMKLQDEFPGAVTVVASFFKNNECVETVKVPFVISDSEIPDGFLLGVYDDGSLALTTPEGYQILGAAGVSLVGQRVFFADDPVNVFRHALTPSLTGLRVMTDLAGLAMTGTSPPEEQDRLVAALLDTLRTINPFAIGAVSAHRVQQIRTILPDTPSALFIPPNGNTLDALGTPALFEAPRKLYIVPDKVFLETIEASFQQANSQEDSQTVKPLFGFIIPDTWKFPDSERLLAAIPWWSLFSGYHQLWWYPLTGSWTAAVTPQGGPSPSFSIVAREVRTIAQGIGSLFLDAHPASGDGRAVSIVLTDETDEPVPTVTSAVRSDGPLTYIGIALDPSAGRATYPDSVRMNIIHTGAPGFLYDVLCAAFIGAVDTVTCSLDRGVGLYALLPYRVQRVLLTVEPIVQPDTPISFTATVEPFETVSPGNHLLRVSITNGEGQTIYTKTVTARDGVYRESIHIHNLASGSVQLMVTDVISGKSAERAIFLRSVSDTTSHQSGE
ncbi:hypothetical protein ACFL5H_01175 [Candidatus Latescibacterota bacterium]